MDKFKIHVMRMPGWSAEEIGQLIDKLLTHYNTSWTIGKIAKAVMGQKCNNPGLLKYWFFRIDPRPGENITEDHLMRSLPDQGLSANGASFIKWWDECKDLNREENRTYAAEDEVFLR